MGEEVSSSNSNTVRRQIPIVCPGHTRPLADIQFCQVQEPDESYRTLLVSACHDRTPMVRDGITGDWIGSFVGHKGAVWSCKQDPLGNLAATASGDFSVKVWDAITGKELYTFPHKHIVKTLDFSPCSKYLATGGHEGILRIYDLEENTNDPLCITQVSEGKKIHISKVSWLDDNTVIAASSDGIIRFWKIESNTEPTLLRTLTVNGEVRDMELNQKLSILTVAAGTTVYFFTMNTTYALIHSYPMPMKFTNEGGASLHPDGTKFIAGGSDLWLRVFDYNTGKQLECLKGHHGPIRCLRYAPDGKTYASGSEDGTIRIWKTDP